MPAETVHERIWGGRDEGTKGRRDEGTKGHQGDRPREVRELGAFLASSYGSFPSLVGFRGSNSTLHVLSLRR